MNSSALIAIGIAAGAVFAGTVVAVVVILAMSERAQEATELPQRMPFPCIPDPRIPGPVIPVPYSYLQFRADSDAEWMLCGGHYIYSAS